MSSTENEWPDPLRQVAAAMLFYTGLISVGEARELAGFPAQQKTQHKEALEDFAAWVEKMAVVLPPCWACWWQKKQWPKDFKPIPDSFVIPMKEDK